MVANYVAQLILSSLHGIRIEHIGSTAVEGCAGKGIIDLMASYSNGELESVKSKLDELGFQKQTTRDPFPETRPMRVGSFEYGGNVFQLHIHVIEKNSPEAVELIEFRNSLRADADLREQYVLLKKSILSQGKTDPIDYCRAKEQFIKKVTHHHSAFSATSILKK
ncbi:MAG: GrpB family protein [Methylococcaceae bacterium]|nr:GrpB family protein [Methylococcaceae bacterium]